MLRDGLRAIFPRHMSLLTLSKAKRERLDSLSTSAGVIEALAIDQRKSLRRMISEAAQTDIGHIPDERLAEFKSAVTKFSPKNRAPFFSTPNTALTQRKSARLIADSFSRTRWTAMRTRDPIACLR